MEEYRKIIKKIILEKSFISFIDFIDKKTFCGLVYQELFKCKIAVNKKWITVIVGIPENWKLYLFDVYLEDQNLFIPHLEKNGKLCLYDLEGTLIDTNFGGILVTVLERAKNIIQEGVNGENKIEFIEEFDSYFNMLDCVHTANVIIPRDKRSKIIKFAEQNKKINKRNSENYATFLTKNKNNLSIFFASTCINDFQKWNVEDPQLNGIYLYINTEYIIYPPNFRSFNALSYINNILKNVDSSKFKNILKKCGTKVFIIFELNQGNGISNCFGFYLKSPSFNIEKSVKLEFYNECIPICVNRIDKTYLQNRTSFSTNELRNKSFLLIGAGSIGSYVFYNLIKSGCENITIVDHDKLTEENIYRHLLGFDYLNQYKTVALSKYSKKSIRNVNVITIEERIEDVVNERGLDFNEYDYVVVATGNHNINRWINDIIIDNNIMLPVFYIWNEPLDIGSHVALFLYRTAASSFDKIFKRDEKGTLYDNTSFCERGQSFVKTFSGCNGSYIPYGSTTSMQSSILFMEVIKMYLNGEINTDVVVSEKGNDSYFIEAGFKVSEKYIQQKDKVSIYIVDNENVEKNQNDQICCKEY